MLRAFGACVTAWEGVKLLSEAAQARQLDTQGPRPIPRLTNARNPVSGPPAGEANFLALKRVFRFCVKLKFVSGRTPADLE